MQYQEEISRVVVANLDELHHDLDVARANAIRDRQALAASEREVARMEALIDLAGDRTT
jgi:hypothetical protein